MRQVLAAAVVSLACFASVAAPARASDETVLEANVPDAVKASVAKKYPGSVVRLWFIEREGNSDNGKIVIYETKAVITTKGSAAAETRHEVALRLSPDGKIVREREAIPVEKVPATVRKAFDASMFGKGLIQKVTRTMENENANQAEYDFEVALKEWEGQKGEFRFDVTFDSTGKMIEQ